MRWIISFVILGALCLFLPFLFTSLVCVGLITSFVILGALCLFKPFLFISLVFVGSYPLPFLFNDTGGF